MQRDTPRQRTWGNKFGCALRGIRHAMQCDATFRVHLVAAAAVIVAGLLLRVNFYEWCALLLCISAVLVAELFNTALEHLARATTERHDQRVCDALDISSGAVLLTAIAAAVVGGIVLAQRLAAVSG